MDDCTICGREIEKNAPSTATNCFRCRMESAQEMHHKRQAWMQAHEEGRLPVSLKDDVEMAVEERAAEGEYYPDDVMVWNY